MNKLKYLSFLFAALVSVGCMFTSCDDDDNNFPIDEQIAGEYKGTLDIALGGQDVMTGDPKNVEITKAAGNAITMTLPEFSFQGMSLGNITLDHIVLSQEGANTYSFTDVRTLTLADPVGACSVESFGVITSNSFTINMEIVWNEISITVAYVGNRLNGTESADNALLAFWFDPSNEANAIVTSQADHLEAGQTTITFSVDENATDEQLAALVPTIQVSDGAEYILGTSSYSIGKTVTVVAENGDVAVYTVKVEGRHNVLKYTFEEWKEVSDKYLGFISYTYTTVAEAGLASCNQGLGLLSAIGFKGGMAVLEDAGYGDDGSSAKMVTLRTVGAGLGRAPAITPGSVFTGTFSANMNDQLSSTSFGIAYDKKPLTMKGVYKYQAGTNFINGSIPDDVKENTGDTDQGSIIGVLYEATDAEGNEVVLDGHTIGSSDYHVAVASFYCSDQAEWAEFSVDFEMLEGKTYDPSKTYKIALVCSSSKDGNLFMGAEGSTLWVDNLEVVGENVTAE